MGMIHEWELGKTYKGRNGLRLEIAGYYRHILTKENGVLFHWVGMDTRSGVHEMAAPNEWLVKEGYKLDGQ